MLLPAVVGWLECEYVTFFQLQSPPPAAQQSLRHGYSLVTLLLVLSMGFEVLVIVLNTVIYQRLIDSIQARLEYGFLERQNAQLKKHFDEMTEFNERLRGMRHDMKNHIAVLAQLASGLEGAEELKDYLSDMHANMGQVNARFLTGLTVIDALLSAEPLYGADKKEGGVSLSRNAKDGRGGARDRLCQYAKDSGQLRWRRGLEATLTEETTRSLREGRFTEEELADLRRELAKKAENGRRKMKWIGIAIIVFYFVMLLPAFLSVGDLGEENSLFALLAGALVPLPFLALGYALARWHTYGMFCSQFNRALKKGYPQLAEEYRL